MSRRLNPVTDKDDRLNSQLAQLVTDRELRENLLLYAGTLSPLLRLLRLRMSEVAKTLGSGAQEKLLSALAEPLGLESAVMEQYREIADLCEAFNEREVGRMLMDEGLPRTTSGVLELLVKSQAEITASAEN